MTKSKIQIVDEYGEGLYVWQLDNGKWIANENRDFLLMPSKKGDERKLKAFTKYAHNVLREAGVEPNGHPVFLPGHRQINDEQYEEQKARQAAGLVADPFDIKAAEDEIKAANLRK